ncbi:MULTISPECIES: NmrA family NAD(P)-binding protein [unclassified Streptomyces]|uniref:NmrA family NAD(P)-binding protein n=1 Tax=unclassified Streptomyces TaxID=2593676 RepID=UPI002DD7B606|nr:MULTISPECIES: NmrA family NAD(P)-binding protein [unclassified Streptomyces]WSA96025.1 NmrA family NAD(P)-binding protein [Streptomyces sp. NBC_01795]WSS11354.1 NmrA family NAD(P)-binding protein [Streptomyces sp. NBC_01186]WSS40064.1 NmrA family NAD(P)-binding protein [Streptomyces sp. NBC_01187]
MSAASAPVLVTGATGRQGGATARALLAAGVPVRALVRDPATDRAQAVAALGAQLVTGDLYEPDSVRRAADGARAVFSVQMPDLNNLQGDSEWVQARNLIDAARDAGVGQFVHTSVSGAGQHQAAPGWAEGRWVAMEHYYESKAAIQDRVREAGFRHWTLLKPAFFMENFLSPSLLLPHGPEGGLVTVLKPGTEISLIAVADIGAAAAAAFADPERFDGVELELAGECLPMTRITEVLSHALGVELSAPSMTADEARVAGTLDLTGGHEWLNVVGQPARPAHAQAYGVPLTGFEEWAKTHLRP